ncbi:MAG: sn-glycerol-1-phosphate dehydrogenase [Rhizobiales bacterium]|nr:sn-glycerol-1-phosphate dehydrogenase [Hyphomicrobiales bacterium]
MPAVPHVIPEALMTGDRMIEALLAGVFPDPESGKPLGVGTRSLVIEKSLAGHEGELLRALSMGQRLAVVSDANTHAVLGKRVESSLAGSNAVDSIILPGHPHPDDATVDVLRKQTASADALVAVGSGTINDLCKYASALDGKPYAVFATAPSMNGYTSYNAAITVHGHKLSLPAQVPQGVFFDLQVLAAAPARLIRAGLGDSLCRCTAQADWLLSHLLFGTEYRTLPFVLLAEDEAPLFDNAAGLLAGDLTVMTRLVRTLVLAGFGTAIVGHSQPASQSEHLVSHYLDMFEKPTRPLVYHGEQVGVTTLSMARLQSRMLDAPPSLSPDATTEADLVKRYGEALGKSCWKELSKKQITAEKAEELNSIVKKDWPSISARLEQVMLPPDYLKKVLIAAGAPVTPEEIHLSRNDYETALNNCREIRNRFTVLDLAAGAKRLSQLIPTL